MQSLTDIEGLELRVKDAETRSSRVMDSMQQMKINLEAELEETRLRADTTHAKSTILQEESAKQLIIIDELRTAAKHAESVAAEMQTRAREAEQVATLARKRKSVLESQTLDLKRKMNQLAQDLLASDDDLRVAQQLRRNLEKLLKSTRRDMAEAKGKLKNSQRALQDEKAKRKELMRRLKVEKSNRAREHETNSQRIASLSKQLDIFRLREPSIDDAGALVVGKKKKSLAECSDSSHAVSLDLMNALQAESALKDQSLLEMADMIAHLEEQVETSRANEQSLRAKCQELEDLNRVIATENRVCVALLASGRREWESSTEEMSMAASRHAARPEEIK